MKYRSSIIRRAMSPFVDHRGIALLLTLVVLVLLTAVIVEFDYGTKVNLITAGNFRDDVKATYLAKAGVAAALAALKEDVKDTDTYDGPDEFWAQPFPPYPVGDGFVSVEVTDESGKLNVNLLAKDQKWKDIWVRLFTVLQIDPTIVDAIKDWVDEDSDTTGLGGAESFHYEREDPPYTSKDGPMDSISEMRLVRGVTDEIYRKLTTGCGGKPCFTVAPTDKINLNTVSVEVCQALHDKLVFDDCQALTGHRPIESIGDETDFPPSWGGLGGTTTGSGIRYELVNRQVIAVKSSFFSIRSLGEVNETRKIITAVVQRKGNKTGLMSWFIQ